MEKIAEKIARFMRGRYGYDAFGSALLWFSIILNIAGILLRSSVLSLLAFLVLILLSVRVFSKNIAKRSLENQKYLQLSLVPRRYLKALRLSIKDRDHRYVLCPKCHQICRIAKGRGKGQVTCPKCHSTFEKRS